MGGFIPLKDASRKLRRFPVITVAVIVLNVLAFLMELGGGEAFVQRWSVLPEEIVAGRHWITILTGMFLHAGWLHILGNMVFLFAFGPEVEDVMGRLRFPRSTCLRAWWLRWRRSSRRPIPRSTTSVPAAPLPV